MGWQEQNSLSWSGVSPAPWSSDGGTVVGVTWSLLWSCQNWENLNSCYIITLLCSGFTSSFQDNLCYALRLKEFFTCSVPPGTVYVISLLSSWLLGHAVPAGSHVRLNLQTGAREVKLQDEDKLRNNLKGLKKGKRYSVNPRDWETDSIDPVILRVMTMCCFLPKYTWL